VLAPDSPERCVSLRVCFLALEVCLGCHMGPSMLLLARDWPAVLHLDYACSFMQFQSKFTCTHF
jgi:hypothetical protein